jgi:hypothetical protein
VEPNRRGGRLGYEHSMSTIPAHTRLFFLLYTTAFPFLPVLSPSSPSSTMRSFATILLSLSLPLHAFAAHAINHAHRHDVALRPRGPNARMTWYDITTGLYVPFLYPHRPSLIISPQYGLWWKL